MPKLSRLSRIEPEFVDLMPRELRPGILYVSMKYATTQHLCACGCGKKVVLPLSPADWNLRYDGENISMSPSVGNWEYSCRSHYWIERNQVHWARTWTRDQVEAGRRRDTRDLEAYFEERGAQVQSQSHQSSKSFATYGSKLFRRLRKLWRS
jgi:hypothetical protein